FFDPAIIAPQRFHVAGIVLLVAVKIGVDEREEHEVRPVPAQIRHRVTIGVLVEPARPAITLGLPLFVGLQQVVVALLGIHRSVEDRLIAGVDEGRARFAFHRAGDAIPRRQGRPFSDEVSAPAPAAREKSRWKPGRTRCARSSAPSRRKYSGTPAGSPGTDWPPGRSGTSACRPTEWNADKKKSARRFAAAPFPASARRRA